MNKENQQMLFRNGAGSHALTNGQPPVIYQQSLSQILKPRLDIRLDYENLHIRLTNGLRWNPDARALIEAIKAGLKHLGDIVRLVAYADWHRLSLKNDCMCSTGGWQRDLAEIGVETRYLVNGNNKNVVDFQMTHDIRDLLEHPLDAPGAADLIILGTNDSDFKGILTAARQRRRRIILLAVKGQLSPRLLDIVDSNDVYYIDEKLRLHKGHYPANKRKQQN